ncbi:uncharacterized protein TRIADDRAFT_23229 [Trichoplax adhaerens]|uniref:Uncharacterized protein n=1 Tax=Trichoplax adhaerens TaxID=10228 RepID=B3RQP6_TRIAD|nr:hypothetical protein TRIADDRAFT_23229 [Trichoplax adhaerens]EDV26732.1 hypothetical protein TRIADDRAFT_23229 [Trichoplax adhaerens]|eukprot:XP_002110728.1 hypothetical protein TRIADDRAFT_23229 [Trichoplax adhaerens]
MTLLTLLRRSVRDKGRALRSVISQYQPSASVHNDGPLRGIKVLDLTRVLAGPYTTMVLGDLGAEVIKIEKPGDGDDTRSWGPPFVNSESTYFLSINRNKKSVVVDLKRSEGSNLVRKLAASCDILIENYLPGKLDKYRLDYESIRESSPGIIYCSISGYGSDGPYRNRPGYDVIAAGIGGLLHITGPEGGDPCKAGIPVTDMATGLYASTSIIAALVEKHKSGVGQKIECNLLNTQVAMLSYVAAAYLNGGLEWHRWGTAHGSIVPYQAFKTADSYIVVGAGNNTQFQQLCKIIQLDNLADDPRFKTNDLRVKYRNDLINTLSERFQQATTSKWLERLENCGFPYGPINTIGQVLNDPQVVHNGLIQTVENANSDKVDIIGPAVTFSESQNRIRSPPPLLGQHTREVLKAELGLDKDNIDRLHKENIIYCA